MKVLTEFTVVHAAEGERCAFMYSEIDDTGRIVSQNRRESCILLEEDVIAHVKALQSWLQARLDA